MASRESRIGSAIANSVLESKNFTFLCPARTSDSEINIIVDAVCA
jgi:hypothetical protein